MGSEDSMTSESTFIALMRAMASDPAARGLAG